MNLKQIKLVKFVFLIYNFTKHNSNELCNSNALNLIGMECFGSCQNKNKNKNYKHKFQKRFPLSN